jgi:hypothetical protein
MNIMAATSITAANIPNPHVLEVIRVLLDAEWTLIFWRAIFLSSCINNGDGTMVGEHFAPAPRIRKRRFGKTKGRDNRKDFAQRMRWRAAFSGLQSAGLTKH